MGRVTTLLPSTGTLTAGSRGGGGGGRWRNGRGDGGCECARILGVEWSGTMGMRDDDVRDTTGL
jgi:hypothetical protein